jgi:DNA-binding MarR family transcriptional regulator
VATGFVTRQAHPSDRRATHVTLTAHGAATAEALAASQQEFAEQLFGDMPASRFAGLVRGLDDVVARLYALGIATNEGSR